MLVFDENINLKLPKKFRSCQSLYKQNSDPLPSRLGLEDLNIAGSGQFSKNTLNAVIKELKGEIFVIDLRKESHGFVNEHPVSWYAHANQSNVDEPDEAIQRQEEKLFFEIKHQEEILVSKILEKKSGYIVKVRQIPLKIASTHTEAALLKSLNVGYLRMGVLDHQRPSDALVDEFVAFVKSMDKDVWLYFHCRGGSGRTTLFMVMYDILKNAHHVSLHDIVQRQAILGGKNIFEISETKENAWKKQAAIKRKDFIEKFYQYVNDPFGFKRKSWSQWVEY